MRKIGIYICCVLAFCFTKEAIGQTDPKAIIRDSLEKSNLYLKDLDMENSFQNIQQNLIQVSGNNPEDEALEYFNLGELFTKKNQPQFAKNYYLESIEIYNNSKQSNKYKKRKSLFSSSKKDKKVVVKSFNELNAYLGLIRASLFANTPKDALTYLTDAESKFKNQLDLQLLKLDVLQANEMWQDIVNLCDAIGKTKQSIEVDSILINKRTLAKAKLGLEDDLLIGYKNRLIQENSKGLMNPETVQYDAEEDLERDEIMEIHEEIETPISSKIKSLSYETQNEIANTYNQNKQYGKELDLRRRLSKNKETNEKQKAKQKLEIGKLYSKNDENQKAISALEESLVLAKASNDIPLQKETVLKLIDLYDEDTDAKKIVQYYKRLQILNQQTDSLIQAEKKEIIAELSDVYDKQVAIKNIQESRDLYQKEKVLEDQASSLTESQMRFQRIVILCLLLGLVIAASVVFWYHKQRSQLKMVNLQLELKNMRNQMNPHFIFNSLNAVNHFIAQRNELLANEYLTEFALLMRNTLNQSDLDLIPLRDELTFLNRYCELEKMRFESKFDFTFTVDPSIDIDGYQIPPLLLQPFVENAVWHGLRYLEHKGLLNVSFTQVGNQLKIEITDNGIGREKSTSIKTSNQKKHQSKGVSLIKRRIHISNQLTPVHITWSIKDHQPQGTCVTLFLSKT